MSKLLTIALMTFNRAELLDKQIEWIAKSIKGYENDCEILISDNCSTDQTPEVTKKWQSILSNTTFRINRNSENIGVIRNLAYCINAATSKHVWILSDDDTIYDETLPYVVNVLKQNSDLGLLMLNFCSRHVITGKCRLQRCFNVENDDVHPNGKALFEQCVQVDNAGGVAFTTALVYRTDLAQSAVKEWLDGVNNLAFQVYITGFCALYGSAKVTKDNFIQCNTGTNFWREDTRLLLKLRHAELPEVYVKLKEIGYASELCQKLVLDTAKKFSPKLILGALRRWPLATINVLYRYVMSILRVYKKLEPKLQNINTQAIAPSYKG